MQPTNHNLPDLNTQAGRFAQTDREAKATLVAAVGIFVYFWLSIALFRNSDITLWSMPLWFMLSCVFGYVLSAGVVFYLLRRVFKNFSLNA